MPLDRELYRNAFLLYRQWNEAKEAERARNAGRITPLESWRRYVALWELCMKLAPPQSERQLEQRLADRDRYFDRIHRFEDWRKQRGKKP